MSKLSTLEKELNRRAAQKLEEESPNMSAILVHSIRTTYQLPLEN